MKDANWQKHIAMVYMAQARATKWPHWRSTLVQWARKCFHQYIRMRRAGQLEMF